MNFIWDTTDHYSNYPEEIKKEYKKNYIKYFNQFTYWIDGISKHNKSNINWLLSTAASRDERESKLYHYLCIYFTLKKNKKNFKLYTIIINSYAFKKVLIRDFDKIFLIKVKKFLFFKETLFIKNIIIYSFQFLFIKLIFCKKKVKSNLILIGTYVINRKIYNFYGNFYKIKSRNKFLVLFFTNTSLKNFIFYVLNLRQKKKILFKENYLRFADLFNSFFYNNNLNFSYRKIFYFNKINFLDIVLEEINYNRYSRSVLQGYLNYFFFKIIKENGLNVICSINSFENQLPDKGWNLGINRFFPKALNIGHQSVSFHPQFQNLYPSNAEYNSNILPNKIYLSGSFFAKERKKFCKKVKFYLTKDLKFKKVKFIKKDIEILILLSGIKYHDIQLLRLVINSYSYFQKKNIIVYFKFHPILDAKYIFKNINSFNYFKEIKGNGSTIIQRSKIVITSSFTAGLYESLIRNCYTLLYNMHPLDYKLYKKFDYINNLLFFQDPKSMVDILDVYINKKIAVNKKNNFKLKKLRRIFFNK
jgi:hypothetical protein